MTPAQARAFHAVAVEGSFTAAAKLLNLSQPTLTHQVKLIESRYKVELFHRTSRGARLTATGAELLAIVRRMFSDYDEAVAFLDEVHGMRQGHLRVGSYEPYDLSRMLVRFIERYPGIRISAQFANSPELSNRLLQYDIDVAVLASTERRDEFLAMPFRQPRLIAIAPRNETWSKRDNLRPKESRRPHADRPRDRLDRAAGIRKADARIRHLGAEMLRVQQPRGRAQRSRRRNRHFRDLRRGTTAGRQSHPAANQGLQHSLQH